MERSLLQAPQLSQLASPPNAILLPVGFTNESRVHVLGHPQVIIPVAVPKNARFPVGSLILEQLWTNGIEMPLNRLPVGALNQTPKAPFALPLALHRTTALDSIIPLPPASVIQQHSKRDTPTKTDTEDTKPLDLTLKSPDQLIVVDDKPSEPTQPIESIPVSNERPFICSCGISFSSLHTLRGHRQFYCRANCENEDKNERNDEVVSGRESKYKCHYCGYIGPNGTQLSYHLRTVHSAIQGYLCQLCGYKGYSVCGMKSHMRSHKEITVKQNTDELILRCAMTLKAVTSPSVISKNKEIPENEDMKEDSKKEGTSTSTSLPPPTILCQQCHAVFPEMELYECHSCTKASISLEKSVKSNENNMSESSDSAESKVHGPAESSSRYSCQFCNYRSQYKGNMKRHLQVIHKMESSNDE